MPVITMPFIALAIRLACLAALTLPLSTSSQATAREFGFLADSSTKQEQQTAAIRDKWALVIGNNQFQDRNIAPLKYASKGAFDFSRALTDPAAGRFTPDHVLLLAGQQCTREQVQRGLEEWLYRKALPNDLVVVYISSRILPSAGTKQPIICVNDTQLNDLNRSGLNLSDLAVALKRRIQSTNIVVILDCASNKQAAPPLTQAGSELPAASLPTTIDYAQLAQAGISIIGPAEQLPDGFISENNAGSILNQSMIQALRSSQGLASLATLVQTAGEKAATLPAAQAALVKPILVASPNMQNLSLGIPVKTSGLLAGVKFGHKLDYLALHRPDIVAPRVLLAKAVEPPGAMGTLPKTPRQLSDAKGTPAADDDDEDIDPNLDFGPYMERMKKHIQSKWIPPKGLESHRVVTVFTIMKDGSILNASVAQGSGVEAVDQSAMEALKAASPLEVLPKGAPRSVNMKYVFEWKTK